MATDNNAATSAWSATRSFTITSAPNTPILVSPADGATTANTTPSLVATFSDPDALDTGQVNFQVCVNATCTGGGDPQRSGSSPAGLTNPANGTWTVSAALANATYYWRAQNIDQWGAVSAWSATRQLIIGAPTITIATPTGATATLGTALPGTDAVAQSTIDVTTNNATGYTLTASDTSDTAGMTRTPATDTIDDWTGTPTTPTIWTTGTSGTNGYFGLTVLTATGGKDTTRWGTGTLATDHTLNKYTGLQTTTTTLQTDPTYNPATRSTTVAYRTNPSNGTLPGDYTTTITYTATTNP